MKLPSFIGLGIMAIGLAAIYIGITDWTPKQSLKLVTIDTAAGSVTSGAVSGGINP